MQDNKISPFKYNRGLAKGAGDAARADVAGDLVAPKAMMGIGATIAGTGIALTQYFGEIGKQYDEFVENVTNNGATLSDENFESLYDELQAGRSGFITGGKKHRALAMKDLTELANSYEDYKGLVENTAVIADSDSGLLGVFKNSPEGSAYLNAVSGKNKLVRNPDPNADNKNNLGVMMNDKWVSMNELKKIGERNSKDTNFASTTEALALQQMKSKEAPNMNAIEYGVTKMVANGKTKSLIHSEIVPGRTFYGDIVTKLSNNSYADLGLTEENLGMYAENTGVNTSDGIDENEAQTIANTMINDDNYKSQLDTELTEYYSNYIAQQNPLYEQSLQDAASDEFNSLSDFEDLNPKDMLDALSELTGNYEETGTVTIGDEVYEGDEAVEILDALRKVEQQISAGRPVTPGLVAVGGAGLGAGILYRNRGILLKALKVIKGGATLARSGTPVGWLSILAEGIYKAGRGLMRRGNKVKPKTKTGLDPKFTKRKYENYNDPNRYTQGTLDL